MSLEDALNANTKAVQEHTAQLKMMLAGAKPAANSGSKPADKPVEKAPPKTTTSKTKGDPTVADVTERVTNFMKVSDKDVRDERKLQVKSIIDHYGADRFTNIDPSKFAEALSFLKAYEDGETPDFGDGDEGGDEDDMV